MDAGLQHDTIVDRGEYEGEGEERPEGIDPQGDAKKKEGKAEVHWIAGEAVGPGRDQGSGWVPGFWASARLAEGEDGGQANKAEDGKEGAEDVGPGRWQNGERVEMMKQEPHQERQSVNQWRGCQDVRDVFGFTAHDQAGNPIWKGK